jgi:hypothetical protein
MIMATYRGSGIMTSIEDNAGARQQLTFTLGELASPFSDYGTRNVLNFGLAEIGSPFSEKVNRNNILPFTVGEIATIFFITDTAQQSKRLPRSFKGHNLDNEPHKPRAYPNDINWTSINSPV